MSLGRYMAVILEDPTFCTVCRNNERTNISKIHFLVACKHGSFIDNPLNLRRPPLITQN